MAKWIAETREVEAEDVTEEADSDETDEMVQEDDTAQDNGSVDRPPHRPRKWKPLMLKVLFGSSPQKESLRTRMLRRAREEEEQYMRIIAELDAEDTEPDAGGVEITDSEVYGE